MIQQSLEKEYTVQVVIELHAIFGEKNEVLCIEKTCLQALEYMDGVLVVEWQYEHEGFIRSKTTMYPWERIRDITFNSFMDQPNPF